MRSRTKVFLLAITLLNSSATTEHADIVVGTVVIDAGHGGKDQGTRGVFLKEKDVALRIALKVGGYIEKNLPGVRVIYTRKDDRYIALDERAAIANTANETDTGISQPVSAGSVLTLSETFTTGVATNYSTSLACTGTTGLSGSTLTVGATDTNIVCTYTNKSIAVALTIAKTDSKAIATSGGTNNYVITLSNAGPGAADGVVVTDVVGAGLTCPSANTVTCSVTAGAAVCPAGTLTFANLTTGATIATFPPNSALQFAYTCNVN